MAKVFEWCACRHPRLAHWCRAAYAFGLVLAIFGSGIAVGSLGAWSRAQQVITAQREDYQATLTLLSGKVATAATATREAASKAAAAAETVMTASETAKSATEIAQEAAVTAKSAARTAGQASGTAKAASANAGRAAAVAEGAAGTLDRALNPPPAPPAEVPDWLNTP
ncbi:hypothetical protein BOFL111202_12470 [Bordetella flabilis]